MKIENQIFTKNLKQKIFLMYVYFVNIFKLLDNSNLITLILNTFIIYFEN